ncbi:hypothetical protein GCM10025331_19100 [Actinoplanes utahensis]|uniref:Uncharacterized protein n=1 Tax=Actinoplanes utahensis TaxID=1869 RepID=A0A0A6UDH1_ACTUT|nr:hypothetical protein MB27_38065 [Actinoplanes utahensis]GIF29645.1 hypothetical protein Aut01nite_26310 [Actinoplanes utahensis]
MRRSLWARLGFAILSGVLTTTALTAPATAAETGVITGTLTDRSGRPVFFAVVSIESVDGSTRYGTGSGMGGDYRTEVQPGTYRVSFQWQALTQWAHQQVDVNQATTITVAAGETVQVDDQLVPTGILSGHLTRTDGTPLAREGVTLWRDDAVVTSTQADTVGFYRFLGVLPGEYRVQFGSEYIPGRFTVAADTTTTADGVLTPPQPEPPKTILVVKAVDSVTNAPVTDFCIQVDIMSAGQVCTDTDTVKATGTRAGQAVIRVWQRQNGSNLHLPKDGVTATLTADETTTVTVPMDLGGQVAFTATGPYELPVQVCYELQTLGRPELVGSGCKRGYSKGMLDQPVPAGTYTVFVRSAQQGFGHQWLGKSGGTGDQRNAAQITVKPGEIVEAPAIHLDEASSISGVVTDPSGKPLSGVGVDYSALPGFQGASPAARTDASGRYVIDDLGPYAWPLLFAPAAEYPYQWSGNTSNRFQATQIPIAETVSYDITLRKGSTLSGAIISGSWQVGLTAHNAITGDVVGVFYEFDPASNVTSYRIPLMGGQQVKLRWNMSPVIGTWHSGATDISTARKISIPRSGVKTLNLTVP